MWVSSVRHPARGVAFLSLSSLVCFGAAVTAGNSAHAQGKPPIEKVDETPPVVEEPADEEQAESDDDSASGEDGAPADDPQPAQDPLSGLDPALAAQIERAIQLRVDRAVEEKLAAAIEVKMGDAVAEKLDEKLDEKKQDGFFEVDVAGVAIPLSFELHGEFFTKFLTRNNASGGCVTYGNPAPEGDNFSGDNGICSTLSLSVLGKVSDHVEVGARIQSRFGAQWASWWENGDLRDVIDGSGESLGMNHAAYMRLRGLYLRVSPPIPTVRSIRVGSSDLAMFNPWTVGKVRFTERDNANGVFVDGAFGDWLSYTFARIALPKLWASAGYNTGIDDPLVENPFWQRDAVYAYKLRSEWDWFEVQQITSYVLDEEADLDDPDALGSTNAIDPRDAVVITNPRYQNVNATLEVSSNWIDWLGLKALLGYSYSRTDEDLVFNSVSGAQGFSPVPMGEHHGYAAVARAAVYDPLDIGVTLTFEYFNIGTDWVSVMGARREADVLLTDGFLDGQLPTLNIANEFQDFNEPFYESIVGWHGATALATWEPWDFILSLETTVIDYNTDTGTTPRDTDKVYPDFLYTDGMTDTEFYSFANTNDRGRDPRSVYKKNQNRLTGIGVFDGAYTLDVWNGFTFKLKNKFIVDRDQRDQTLTEDDYLGLLSFNRVSVEAPLTDEFSGVIGYQFDYWWEQHRSGDVIAGVANYPDYITIRQKAFLQARYVYEGLTFFYHLEYLNKDVDTTDDRLDYSFRHVLRSIAMVSASF